MDIKEVKQEPQEPVSQEEDIDCQVIKVVDLTKQVQKDVGQTMAELKAHVSLKLLSIVEYS